MAKQPEVKKVGGAAAAAKVGAPVSTKVGKPGKKTIFDVKTATLTDGTVIKLDEDGALTAAPANWDSKKHKPIKAKMFANDGALNDYKALVYDQRAAGMKVQADKYREAAETFRKYGDPEKRKAMSKMSKIADQFIALQSALSGDGGGEVDIPSLEELLKKAKEKAAAKKAATK